jgi:hypothetical protein
LRPVANGAPTKMLGVGHRGDWAWRATWQLSLGAGAELRSPAAGAQTGPARWTTRLGRLGLAVVWADGLGSSQTGLNTASCPGSTARRNVAFDARDGAGCNLIGGAGSSSCPLDFQSPGPFGTTTALVVP